MLMVVTSSVIFMGVRFWLRWVLGRRAVVVVFQGLKTQRRVCSECDGCENNENSDGGHDVDFSLMAVLLLMS